MGFAGVYIAPNANYIKSTKYWFKYLLKQDTVLHDFDKFWVEKNNSRLNIFWEDQPGCCSPWSDGSYPGNPALCKQPKKKIIIIIRKERKMQTELYKQVHVSFLSANRAYSYLYWLHL